MSGRGLLAEPLGASFSGSSSRVEAVTGSMGSSRPRAGAKFTVWQGSGWLEPEPEPCQKRPEHVNNLELLNRQCNQQENPS